MENRKKVEVLAGHTQFLSQWPGRNGTGEHTPAASDTLIEEDQVHRGAMSKEREVVMRGVSLGKPKHASTVLSTHLAPLSPGSLEKMVPFSDE